MLEQTSAKFESNAANFNISHSEAQSAAQKMLTCVELHERSTARDGNDKAINTSAMATDEQSSANAARIKSVDARLMADLSAGEPISTELREEALKLHMQSRDLNNADAKGDLAAQVKDAKDIKEEQKVINADLSLMRSDKISPSLRSWLQADVQAKVQLQQSEKQDIPAEQAFAATDAKDQKMNKVMIDALTSNSPNLSSYLWSDFASKDGIISTRQDDLKAELGYSDTDTRDQSLNNQLTAELRMDPYLAFSLRTETNLPVWAPEQKVHEAEMLQHERRRLRLPVNANAEQVRMAQEADMNKQLGLPIWDTKAQRIEYRETSFERLNLPVL